MKDPKVVEMEKKIMEKLKNYTDTELKNTQEFLNSIQKDFDKGFEIADTLAHLTNIMSDDDRCRGFVEGLNRQHRTLQQNVMRYFLTWVYKLADLNEDWYDLRNEYSVKCAKKIKEVLGEYGNNCPFI